MVNTAKNSEVNSVLAHVLPAVLQVNLIIEFLLLVRTWKPERMHLDSGYTVLTGLAGRKIRLFDNWSSIM